MDFKWIEHWVWENNYSDEISKWISLELGEINSASERKNFSCQRGSWMMSGWKAWTDVLPEGGNICGWVSDVNGIISSVQAEAAIKTHLDNFAPTKRKHNFVIYFKVYCYERWKSMSIRTQGEGTKDDKHLRKLEGEDADENWNVKKLEITKYTSAKELHFASVCWKVSRNSILSKHQWPSSIYFLSNSRV